MAVTFLKRKMDVVGNVYGAINTLSGPEGAGQTFTRGSLVIATAGLIVVGTADTPETLLGMSQSTASGVTRNPCQYHPFLPGTIIEANILEAAAADHVLVAADLFVNIGYQISTNWYLNTGVTADADVVAMPIDFAFGLTTTGLRQKAAIGDTNARVTAIIVQSAFIPIALLGV